MKKYKELPAGYTPMDKIERVKDKKPALLVVIAAFATAVLMALIANPFAPLRELFSLNNGSEVYLFRLYGLFLGLVLYIGLHEAVHGIFMWCLSGKRPRFGFNGIYVYAGSKAYFNKKSYFIIAFAPIVLLGVLLLLFNHLVPHVWFWVVYLIQITNVSGAVSDIYLVIRMRKLPPDILIQDTGVAMTVFSKDE